MNDTAIYFVLILTGLCFGSFAGASVWRLRAKQLDDENLSTKESKKLSKLRSTSILADRSKCLECSYVLRWFDLIPIISWLALRGRCRKCHKPIGYMEPIIELGVAIFFVLSFLFWPYPIENAMQIAVFVIWLIAGIGLSILFAYDFKWGILPDRVNFTVIGLGLISAVLTVILAQNKLTAVFSVFGGVAILSGLYFALYTISHGKWVGFGDIKLGLGLALLLGDWKLAFVALFAANLIGCLIILPFLAAGKLKRDSHVPFGPLLIIGTFVAELAGAHLVNIFLALTI